MFTLNQKKYVERMLKFLRRKKISIPYNFSIQTIEDLVYLNGGTTSVSKNTYKQYLQLKGDVYGNDTI